MKVEMVRGTERPEDLVARAARNDYRSEGIIGYTLEELLEDSTVDETVKERAAAYLEEHDDHEFDLDTEVRKRSLLKHLMDGGHWGPFEHPQATVAIEGVTRVAMAQITRHRHFTFDIMSLRYVSVDDIDETDDRFQIPEVAKQDEAVSRDGVSELDDDVEDAFIGAYEDAIEHYRELLDKGVPQEEARKVLPMGTKVNIVMSGNARAWMHLLNIRGKANVQGEARRIADALMEELRDWMPYAFEYYDDEVLPLRLNP